MDASTAEVDVVEAGAEAVDAAADPSEAVGAVVGEEDVVEDDSEEEEEAEAHPRSS